MNAINVLNATLTQSIRLKFIVIFTTFLCSLCVMPSSADTSAKAVQSVSPRLYSHSDLFELVGVVDGNLLKIYLDRYLTNEPVVNADIEVEAGNIKGLAVAQPDGSYSFTNDVFSSPGTLAVSFTVRTGDAADLLVGDLAIGHTEDEHSHVVATHAYRVWWFWAACAGVAILLMATAVMVRRRHQARKGMTSSVYSCMAAGVFLLCAAAAFDVSAGPGHDHGEEAAPVANGNAPKRQLDGSVFLPKQSQRQLLIRTDGVEEKSLPKTVELTGRVVADANASGKVQPIQAGRIEASPRGLPILGQTVRKGEVLALVRTSSSAIERANQQSQTSELRYQFELAKGRVARLEQLEGTVPQKDIDAARLDMVSLRQRVAAVGASVLAAEPLTAPVSGVIAATHVVAGQVVDAREVLFEIVDPTRLSVEANSFDAALTDNIASASIASVSGRVALQFSGAGRTLREGALPLLFHTAPGQEALPFAVNQPVKVVVQTKVAIKGFALPAAAVIKNASNQDMVWVHTTAETFVPRTVRITALDGNTVSVVDGLKAGERVVTQGAPLVNQVR